MNKKLVIVMMCVGLAGQIILGRYADNEADEPVLVKGANWVADTADKIATRAAESTERDYALGRSETDKPGVVERTANKVAERADVFAENEHIRAMQAREDERAEEKENRKKRKRARKRREARADEQEREERKEREERHRRYKRKRVEVVCNQSEYDRSPVGDPIYGGPVYEPCRTIVKR